MIKWLDYITRITVGGLFIFSGLVKLNDPRGTQIKLEEYFEVFANDFTSLFHHLIPAALTIGLILVILEIVLGVAVLLYYKMKWTSWMLLALILFFTFLTFYSAYFNKVTDCGCFGDAIPLDPWQSFYKDIILLVLIAFMFVRRNEYKDLLSAKISGIALAGIAMVSMFLGIYAIRHLPFIDFRPYAIGDNIPANMIAPEKPHFLYMFEKNGEKIESEKYLTAEDGFVYVSHRITNAKQTIPKITDYNIWNEELGDYTEQSFIGPKLFIIIYDANTADVSKMDEIKTLVEGTEGVETIILTASLGENMRGLLGEYQINVPFFYTDATVLKAMIRSSPGIMLVANGTVLGKWHYNDVPDKEKVFKLL